MTTNLGAMPSTFQVPGKVQIKRGAADGAPVVNNVTTYGTILSDGAGGTMSISYTTTHECFWHIRANVMSCGIPGSSGGLWQRWDWDIACFPNDADGRQSGMQVCTQNFDQNTVQWRTTSGTCMFRLAAATAYTVHLRHMFSSGYNQQYHTGPLWLRLIGRIVGEGSAI